MNAITLRAHYDGQKIVLDEPIKLKLNAKLIITVLPQLESDPKISKIQEERNS